jgi:hypothetical protein
VQAIRLSNIVAEISRTVVNTGIERTDEMTEIDDLMKRVNDGMSATKDNNDFFRWYFATGLTDAEAQDFVQKMVDAGIDENAIHNTMETWVPGGLVGTATASTTHGIFLFKPALDAASKNMTATLDDLSDDAQKDQLKLQKWANLIANLVDMSSNVTKKWGDTASLIGNNVR